MPSWGKWVLIASVAVALIIMLVAWLITRRKINRVRDEYLASQNAAVEGEQKTALDKRDTFAQYLWDLQEKAENPTPQNTLEYVMNTAIRNNYKKGVVINGSKFEEESFKKLTDMKIVDKDFSLVFIANPENVNDTFDEHYQSIRTGGMIAIAKADKKNAEIKKLLEYLKMTGIRNEMLKIDKGLLLVVK